MPIVRGPEQKEVWTFAKALAVELASRHPALMTSEYRVAKRPKGRVLVDYNQNAWGRTLASIYSVRPTPLATVSTPVTWEEVAAGVAIEDFRLDNVRAADREGRRSVEAAARGARPRPDLDTFLKCSSRSIYSPSSSPTGFRSSIRSQHAFTATSIGTASSVPQMPQTKLQKIRPTKTATSFVRAVRLVSHGVSSQPSRLVMASEMPDDVERHRRSCRTAGRRRRRCRRRRSPGRSTGCC